MTTRIKHGTDQGPRPTATTARDDASLRCLVHRTPKVSAAFYTHPSPEEAPAHLMKRDQPVMSAADLRLMRQIMSCTPQTVVEHYRHMSPKKVRAHLKDFGPAGAGPAREPFRLYRLSGSNRYRMTFCMSGVRYAGSTLTEDHGLAIMAARAVYAEIKETAGRLSADDIRRRERTLSHVRGWWLTSRPKRLPLLAGKARIGTD